MDLMQAFSDYRAYAHTIARRVSAQSQSDYEDILAEADLALWNALTTFKGDYLKGWIQTRVHWHISEFLKKDHIVPMSTYFKEMGHETPTVMSIDDVESAEKVERAGIKPPTVEPVRYDDSLNRYSFTPRERLIVQYLIQGYNPSEIARELGWPVPNAYYFVKQIKSKVRVTYYKETGKWLDG
jgi:DNA-directed RNA polymerase specialized sigma24 family protein